jgi:ferredoxin-NADP reductase
MLQPWQTGKVINIVNESTTTKTFFIETKDVFDFLPGQFITLDLPIHEQKNKRWRSYSISSSPNGSNIIELVVVLLENGVGTNYLFNQVQVGSELVFRGPTGKFVLPEIIDRDLFFICTGTGVAPFRSMINFIVHNNIPHKGLHLFFGCRTADDCLYKDEFLALQNLTQDFHYHPCFSRETASFDFAQKGYVHESYKKVLEDKTNLDTLFYLCGWKNMIDEAKENIIQLGYDKHAIHLELYG